MRGAGDAAALRRVAAMLPDIPRWVELRALALSGEGKLLAGPSGADEQPAVLIRDHRLPLLCVAGRPPSAAIRRAVGGAGEHLEVITAEETAGHLARSLGPDWRSVPARLHTLPGGYRGLRARTAGPGRVHILAETDGALVDALPAPLRKEIATALERRQPVAAAVVDGRAVSFCYAAYRTETLWDVSVETLEPYRRRGLAERCMAVMTERMGRDGLEPVWGATETNAASLGLAERLGFAAVDRLIVFGRRPRGKRDASSG